MYVNICTSTLRLVVVQPIATQSMVSEHVMVPRDHGIKYELVKSAHTVLASVANVPSSLSPLLPRPLTEKLPCRGDAPKLLAYSTVISSTLDPIKSNEHHLMPSKLGVADIRPYSMDLLSWNILNRTFILFRHYANVRNNLWTLKSVCRENFWAVSLYFHIARGKLRVACVNQKLTNHETWRNTIENCWALNRS